MPHPTPAHKAFADRASLYQEITDKIIAELEQGRLPWVQPWAGVSAPLGLPRNAAPAAPMVASISSSCGARSPSAASPAKPGSPSARR